MYVCFPISSNPRVPAFVFLLWLYIETSRNTNGFVFGLGAAKIFESVTLVSDCRTGRGDGLRALVIAFAASRNSAEDWNRSTR